MKTTLTSEQIAFYRDNGYLIYPDFLDADELKALRVAVLDAVAAMGRRKVAGAGAALIEGDEYYDRVFTQRINLWRLSDVVRACLHSADLGRMLCDLEGVDGMRLGHDQALIKEPFANPTTLHVDNPYWSFSSRHAISIWIALDDATVANGCLCFLPGSHKLARFESVRFRDEFGALTEVYPEMRAIQPFVAEMKAGDCSFHNGLTAHGAGVNMTNGRRIAMACGYMPEGSRFNGQQNVYPESYVSALALDAVLDNEAFNPLIYSRA